MRWRTHVPTVATPPQERATIGVKGGCFHVSETSVVKDIDVMRHDHEKSLRTPLMLETSSATAGDDQAAGGSITFR
jgi:hypothetical protein